MNDKQRPHLTMEEAKRQNLPGSDTFRFSHILYHDERNRDASVVDLNTEALKAFSDTLLISQRNELAFEAAAMEAYLKRGGLLSGDPCPPIGAATQRYMHYFNYENFKIASGFELHLKARLIARDFVIHEIHRKEPYKSLAKKQLDQPITKQELFEIQSYLFNGRQNYLPGLTDFSLKFSWLTEKDAYNCELDLPFDKIDIIDEYRRLRNEIHLPGDVIDTPNIREHSAPDFITEFVNSEIVDWSNRLIEKRNLCRQKLAKI